MARGLHPSAPDEWLVAENIDGGRTFVVHTRPPRFIAEVCDECQLAPLMAALSNGQELAWFVWQDPPPASEEALLDLLGRADAALTAYDGILDADARRAKDGDDEDDEG